MNEWKSRTYDIPMPLHYSLGPWHPNGLVIALHGYQDKATSWLKRIGWSDRELPFQLLAINGPFPVPVWKKDEFKEAYSWYFRDASRGLTIVAPETTAQMLSQLISDLKLTEVPKVIFGFSQGGYLAPYLALHMTELKGIVGLGCGYRTEPYEKIPHTHIEGIHGSSDERIDLIEAEREFKSVLSLGHTGSFSVIDGLMHSPDERAGALAERLCVDTLNP